ncbi:BnaA09g50720D [Brassica napus]|uniref:BnaA09g50720D protein n=1 Tax=Brassica napus TaxID=3708 RepID=A0A078H558_BRANA|nr:BnaA09g50720D [Brassica napus]
MANFTNMLMNPWVLHLQKLDLELKCPLCLKLLNQPVLLPCDHIFCDSCIHESSQVESGCPVCKSKHSKKARRNLPFMESVISIYKSLNAAVIVHLPQLQIRNTSNGGSEDSEMIDKDVIKGNGGGSDSSSLDGSPLPASESDNSGNHTPESQKGPAAKCMSGITASEQFCNAARKRICVESFSRDDSMLPKSKDSTPNPITQDQTVNLLMENVQSCDNGKAQIHQQLPESHTEQAAKRKCDITVSEAMENHQKVYKRQKNLMQKADDIELKNNYTSTSDDQLIGNTSKSSDLTPSVISDKPSSNITICGFCQSARVSEASGEMLHYSRGNPVFGDDIFRSNVIHVHSACIEWAPQVYYEADTVKNLKAELARGMKIKCTKCSLKGAALGCYVKSCRRSYHVPCAREMSRCRWDNEDFLLLCPAHSSVKFPSEKSRPRCCLPKADSLPEGKSAELCPLEDKPAMTKDLVLCGSALSQDDKRVMEKLAAKLNATISRYWNPSVTHVIASTNEKGACTRTLKVLMGILNGKWIINADWMKASLEASQPVDEEQYEIHIDTQGCQDGPKTARLRAASNKPKLFDGLKFYFHGDFFKGYKEDLQNLVKVAGESSNNVSDSDQRSSSAIVVYNIDPPPGCGLGEEGQRSLVTLGYWSPLLVINRRPYHAPPPPQFRCATAATHLYPIKYPPTKENSSPSPVMGCFPRCFGRRSNRRRQKRRESDQGKANNLSVEYAKPVHLSDRVSAVEEIIPKSSVIPITETCEESPSPTRKRVTFDSKVKTHDHIALQESVEELLQEEKQEVVPEVNPSKAGQSSSEKSEVASNPSGSHPSNYRYENCRESDDEVEEDELNCGESDLDEEFYSDEAFSEDKLTKGVKIDAKLRRFNESVGDGNHNAQGVLNPVENLTQWKAAKSNGKTIQKQSQKENSNLISDQQDKKDSFSFGCGDSQTDEAKKAGNKELTVDASLSTWLSTSETGSECNSVSNTPEKSKPASYSKRVINSHDERPVLCALTSEEIKQFSAASTPRKSPRKSHDETPIIGTVGGYWGDHSKAVDSGGSVSSFKGIPNTTSKYREDKSVNWHSTPFEARLEKALKRDK